jgi:two-component system, NtrC family, sensor kinase
VPQLVYHPGRFDERSFALAEGTTVIGRASECEVCILDNGLSRRHSAIETISGKSYLVDLRSKNGSFVNGVRVDREALQPGDVIRLGEVLFTLANEAPSEGSRAGYEPQPTLVMPLTSIPIGELRSRQGDPTERARSRLAILLSVSRVLAGSEDADTLLEQILDLVFESFDVDRAALLLPDATTGFLEPWAARCREGRDGPIYSRKIADYAFTRGVAALFASPAQDPRLDASGSLSLQAISASMAAPLCAKGRTLGVLYLDNLDGAGTLDEGDLELCAAIADHAALALDNASLRRRIEEEAVARTQLAMEAKLAALAAMVSGIAHELRNPLNFITNFAELSGELAAEVAAGLAAERARITPRAFADLTGSLAELEEDARKIIEHGRRADAIIGSMLLHASGASRERAAADVNALLAQSLRVAVEEARARDAGLDLVIDAVYDESVGLVEMVSADIHRVLVNVIDNACYAMREKQRALGAAFAPRLTVRTVSAGEWVEIRILDNGTGIPREIEGRVFHPFFTTKPAGAGAGLGLSLSHDVVVEGHRGAIRLSSSPGEQTEVVIALPRKAPGARTSAKPAPSVPV